MGHDIRTRSRQALDIERIAPESCAVPLHGGLQQPKLLARVLDVIPLRHHLLLTQWARAGQWWALGMTAKKQARNEWCVSGTCECRGAGAVSYTHLTLPTILLV